MRLLRLRHNSSSNPHLRTVTGIDAVIRTRCAECNYGNWPHPGAQVTGTVESGSSWPDFMLVGDLQLPFLVTEKVADDLSNARVANLEYSPVLLRSNDATSYRRYFHVVPPKGIAIDQSKTPFKRKIRGRCAHCGMLLFEPIPKGVMPDLLAPDRVVPDEDTWDGSDLFIMRDYPMGHAVFCTERILLLARERRWSNCRFEPVDTSRHQSVGWDGIDYLGTRWPPQWYPKPASEGMSPKEWGAELQSGDSKRQYAAIKALMELGVDSVDVLASILRSKVLKHRLDAARILQHHARKGVAVPRDVSDAAARILADIDPGYMTE